MRSTVHAVNRASDAALGTEKEPREPSIQQHSIRRIDGADAIKHSDNRRRRVEGDSEMSRDRSSTMAVSVPAPLRPATLRAGLVLAVIAAMAAFAVRVGAQEAPATASVSSLQVQLATSLTFGS